jgi:predicted transcriptional regulator
MAILGDEYLVTTAGDLGAALKHYRRNAGISQQAAADSEGIGQPYLSSLEGGRFGRSLTHTLRLLRLVGCELVVRPVSRRG